MFFIEYVRKYKTFFKKNSTAIFNQIDSLREVLSEIQSLCKPNENNLVLYKNITDIFYAIGTKEKFKEKYGKNLNFIVKPQHEFLMKI